MTPRERSLLDAIERLTVDGVVPTYTALARAVGLASKSGIHRMVSSLIEQGHLTRREGKWNCIELVRKADPVHFDLTALNDNDLRDLFDRVEQEASRRAERAAA